MNDVRKMIYGSLIGFFTVLGLWFSIIYISSCGLTLTCNQAEAKVERTPIPTLIPASHSESQMEVSMEEFNKCEVAAGDLIGAWVSAGASETEAFPFTDANEQTCEGTYEDIQPLFVENNLWYSGSLGCVSCHNADLTERSSGLDLTTYEAVLLGSRRVAGSTSPATDVLGNGNWEESRLYEILVNQGLVPAGHSADTLVNNPILYAGSQVDEVEATPTP
jgi:hypothetical protein